MNTFGRTKENKKKLKLKRFHKRQILTNVISSIRDCVTVQTEDVPIKFKKFRYNYGEFKSIGSSRGNFRCVLEEIGNTLLLGQFKKTYCTSFKNKPLKGKIVLIKRIQYRVISN